MSSAPKKEKVEDVLNEAVEKIGCYNEHCLPVLAELVVEARFKAAIAEQTSLKIARDFSSSSEVAVACVDAKLELLRDIDQLAALNGGDFEIDDWIEKLQAVRAKLIDP